MDNVVVDANSASGNRERLMEMLSKCKDEQKINYLADVMELQQMLDNAQKRSA